MTSATDLAAMLCSRLCHDMLSPIGALNNGLELLADESDPEVRKQCLELLEQSAVTSANKLKFFRLAFGAAGGFGDAVPIEEAQDVINALAQTAKGVEVNWAIEGSSLPKPAVKVMLNFAQMALDALVRGGTLDIGGEIRDGAAEIAIRASGRKVAFDDRIGAVLQGKGQPDDISSRTAAAYMIALLAKDMGGGLQFQANDKTLVLGAVLPQPEGMIG